MMPGQPAPMILQPPLAVLMQNSHASRLASPPQSMSSAPQPQSQPSSPYQSSGHAQAPGTSQVPLLASSIVAHPSSAAAHDPSSLHSSQEASVASSQSTSTRPQPQWQMSSP